MSIYCRHTLAHHQFFTEREPTIDTVRDFRATFLPAYAFIALVSMTLPLAGLWFSWPERPTLAGFGSAPPRSST
jgi:hypothetical protein